MSLFEEFGINPETLLSNKVIPKPALMSLVPPQEEEIAPYKEPDSWLGKIWERVKEEAGGAWEDSKNLWDMSEEESFFPGTFHKGLSLLNALDIPRRTAWGAAAPIVLDPALKAMGLEHPEDYSSGFEVGNELAEVWGKKSGAFDGSVKTALNPKSWPIIAAQTLGNTFDIYSDPLSMVTAKTGDAYKHVQKELSLPRAEPLHIMGELGESRNPSFTRSYEDIGTDLEGAAKAYTYKKEILDKVNDLVVARDEISKTVQDPIRRKDLNTWIDNQLFHLSDVAKKFQGIEGKDLLPVEAREGAVLPKGINNPLNLDSTVGLQPGNILDKGKEVREVRSLNFTEAPPELKLLFPEVPASLTPSLLSEKVNTLLTSLRRERPGVKGLVPFSGKELPLPVLTDASAALGKGLGKISSGVQDLFHRAAFKAPSTYDVSARNAPVTDKEVLEAIYSLEPALQGKEIKVGDVEAFLSHASQVPGGVRTYAQAKDFAQRLKTSDLPLERLKPLYNFLSKMVDQDTAAGYEGRGLSSLNQQNIKGILKGIGEEISQAEKAQELFRRPLALLQKDNITFDQLKEVNKKRIYQWMLRQMREHNVDDQALLSYTGLDPEQITRIRDRVKLQAQLAPEDKFDAALEPKANFLATLTNVDGLVREQANLFASQTAAIQGAAEPIVKLNEIFKAQLNNTPFLNNFISIMEKIGTQMQYSPPPYALAQTQEGVVKGLIENINELQTVQLTQHNELNKLLEHTNSRNLLDLLYMNSGKIGSALKESFDLWAADPALAADLTNPVAIKEAIVAKLGKAAVLAGEKQINDLSVLLAKTGEGARQEFVDLLNKLEDNLKVYKAKQRSFNESIIPIRAISEATKPFIEPAYNTFLAQSADALSYATQMLYNPNSANIPALGKLWLGFKENFNRFTRLILKDFGIEPELVEKNKEMMHSIDYWKERAPVEAQALIYDGIYKPLFEKYGIVHNYRKIDQLDNGFAIWYNSGDSTRRVAQGKKPLKEIGMSLVLEAFDGNQAAAQDALATLSKFNEEQTRIMRLNENQAGVPTKYLERYMPNMLKFEQGWFGLSNSSIRDREKFKDALALWKKPQKTSTPSFFGGDFSHSHHRMFENLDEFETFLEMINGTVSGNEFNVVGPSNLKPETSYINLFAQRLQNHYIALNTINYLKELEMNFPHLIRSLKGANADVDSVLEQIGFVTGKPGEELLNAISELEPSPTQTAQSLVGGKERWSLRGDFARYLEASIPYGNLNEPAHVGEAIIKYLSQLNYRIQGFNTAYNAGGHIKNIIALALIQRMDLTKIASNFKNYGPNPRNHPLYDMAARVGVFPWAGIEHNKNVRELMNIKLGRPKTGPIDNPVLYGDTGAPLELKVGGWNLLRIPNVGMDRMMGFLAQFREPEYFRHVTWDIVDKQLRLALFEQALAKGMNKVDAAEVVRNALVDYQLSWMHPRTKAWANAFFPFTSWWMGNLRIHLPNMIQEPRFYVIANQLMNIINQYSIGSTMEENPSATGNAIAMPFQNGPELLYWELGLPWMQIQNKIFKKMIEIWTAPSQGAEALDLGGRMGQTIGALLSYLNSRARSIPDQLIKAVIAAKVPEAGQYLPQFQSDENFWDYVVSAIQAGFWGVNPIVEPFFDMAAGQDPANALVRSFMGQFGEIKRMLPNGEIK